MSECGTRRYRVAVLEPSTYAVYVEASSASEAEDEVRRLWDRGETEQFQTKEVSLDYFEAEPL